MSATQLRGYKPFLKIFGEHPDHQHDDRAFRDWLEMVWVFMNAAYDRPAYEAMEAQTPKPIVEWWGRGLGLYVELAEEADWGDVSGPVYEELNGSRARARAGQFFTPFNICLMMAKMTLGDPAEFKAKVERGEKISVCDPCVGSGAMLLAFAIAVRDEPELGYRYIDALELYGQDIDKTCILMTQVQLRINGLDQFGRAARLAAAMTPAMAAMLTFIRELEATPEPPTQVKKFIQFGLLRPKTKEVQHVGSPPQDAGAAPAVPARNRAARRRDKRVAQSAKPRERAARRRARRAPADTLSGG